MAHIPAQERRRQIVEAAVVVLREAGLDQASTRRIAEQAGAPLASLYYTFHGKEEILAAVYQHWIELMSGLLADLVPAGCGFEAGVRKLMTGFFDWIAADRTLGVAQYELVVWSARTRGEVELAGSVYASFQEVCLVALRRAATEPITEAALAEAVDIVITALDGILIRFLVDGDEDGARRNIDRFVGMAVRARS